MAIDVTSGTGRPADYTRWVGSAVLGTVVVLMLMTVALWIFGVFRGGDDVHYTHSLRLLTDSERRDLAAELGEGPYSQRPRLPPLAEIPPLEIPRRKQSGFVQLEFSVDADGRVVDAEVVRAAPAGVYEEQALAILRGRRFEAEAPGAPDARRTEIIDFDIEPAPATD